MRVAVYRIQNVPSFESTYRSHMTLLTKKNMYKNMPIKISRTCTGRGIYLPTYVFLFHAILQVSHVYTFCVLYGYTGTYAFLFNFLFVFHFFFILLLSKSLKDSTSKEIFLQIRCLTSRRSDFSYSQFYNLSPVIKQRASQGSSSWKKNISQLSSFVPATCCFVIH